MKTIPVTFAAEHKTPVGTLPTVIEIKAVGLTCSPVRAAFILSTETPPHGTLISSVEQGERVLFGLYSLVTSNQEKLDAFLKYSDADLSMWSNANRSAPRIAQKLGISQEEFVDMTKDYIDGVFENNLTDSLT